MMDNSTTQMPEELDIPAIYDMRLEDATWVLTSAFIIFTMQTGFGMLESGCVSMKNEVNIMMKNIVDVVFGGLTYWIFGYGLSFGREAWSNGFISFGDFMLDPAIGDPLMGQKFTAFMFQLSFATTATTIVSGAMAERCSFKAYTAFSLLNTLIYAIPAGWVWGPNGFLAGMGCVDIAGSGPVHLIGGAASFGSAYMLGPRLGRYVNGRTSMPMGNPVNACMGLFVLWWGWLAFNAGSTYGISASKWIYSAKAAVMTMIASFGGGTVSIFVSMYKNEGKVQCLDLINGILGALVGITAGCFLYSAWESLVVGAVGALLVIYTTPYFDMIGVDDPVGASAVHGVGGIWGVVAVGLFADLPLPLETTSGRRGLFRGGGWDLLGIQSLAALCLTAWGVLSTILLLWCIDRFVPIRAEPHEELLGADLMEHKIRHGNIGVSRALSALAPIKHEVEEFKDVPVVGTNPHQSKIIERIKNAGYTFNYLMHAPNRSVKRIKSKVFPMTRKDRNVLAIEPRRSSVRVLDFIH